MKRFSKTRRQVIRWVSVILALVCAFCLFMPRLHACDRADCLLCALSALQGDTWAPVPVALLWLCVMLFSVAIDRSEKQHTKVSLVQLKVKLSN